MNETPKPLRSLVEKWRSDLPWTVGGDDTEPFRNAADALEAALEQWEAFCDGKLELDVEYEFRVAWVRQHILGPRGE